MSLLMTALGDGQAGGLRATLHSPLPSSIPSPSPADTVRRVRAAPRFSLAPQSCQ